MNPIVYALPVFMLTMLIEAMVARWRGVDTYDLPDTLTSLHLGVLSQVASAFTKVLGFGLYVAVYERFRITDLPTDAAWLWVGALVLYDFLYYWVHRWGHEVNLVWAAHQVHHSSEYYNLSTALRQTSTGAFVVWPFFLLMAVLGVPPVVFGVVALIDLLYQYWVHTEMVGKLGWVDRVFVTPSNHRVHHGQNDYCIDKNYGGIFILWDRLFGTFAEERDHEQIFYGVRKPLASYNAVWGNCNVWRDLWRASRAAWQQQGASAAVAVWFGPPAGWGGTLEHLDTATLHRFDRATPASVRRYAFIQYAITVVCATHFIAIAPQLNWAVRAAYALIITAGALSTGWLLEGRARARAIEAGRLVVVGGLFLALPLWFGWQAPPQVKLAVTALLLTSLAWVAASRDRQPARDA